MSNNPSLFESRNTAEFGVIESEITLRDLFAMAALLQSEADRTAADAKRAYWAYELADAMLAERATR